MHEIPKGANIGLATLSEDTGSIQVALRWTDPSGTGEADVSVLLLDANGKVRSDEDFYFYNNPASADGSVQVLGSMPTADGSEDRISLDLTAIPAGIERIVVAASRYGSAPFGELEDLRLVLADATGEPLLGFSIDDASVETAFVFGEIYRRYGEWKFRAVGQGYHSGLAGLATDYGINVTEDEPEGEPQAAAPEPVEDLIPSQTAPSEAQDDAPRVPEQAESAQTAPRQRRVRIAKKKVTLPSSPKKSLAENESWRSARLFPVPQLKSDREREVRATSVLLSVLAQVPEFGRRLTAGFNAPAGAMETFVETSFTYGETTVRPDGVIRASRAGKIWTALVETKTNGNPLKDEQVQSYMDIAARRGYEAVVTLSNDVALPGSPLVSVKVDGRRKHKVALWHLSWAEVVHQAQMLVRHEGVANPAHAWLLQELLHYLQHENSGCHGFQNMGTAWVPLRNAISEGTLVRGDKQAMEVVESWERLIQQVSLRLGGELGEKVSPVRTKRGTDPQVRRAELADRLVDNGQLHAEIHIESTVGTFAITADLRTGKLRTSIEVPTPEQGYPLAWAKRLVRQLAEAPADLHVETLLADDQGVGPRGTLEKLRPEPGDLLPKDSAQIKGFRLSLSKTMGNTRGSTESGFIRSVDTAVDRFHSHVITHLRLTTPRRGAQHTSPTAD